MKKEDIISALVYLVLVAAAIIVGYTVVEPAFRSYDSTLINPYIFSIFTLIFALAFNVVGLELLHAWGAKIGGYEVVSINMLGFCFEKIKGKWKFSFKNFDGLTGETTIAPAKETTNLKPYVWAPFIGYVTEIIVGVAVYYLVQGNTGKLSLGWLGIGALLFIIISSMIAIYNIIPFKLDCTTDGYRLLLSTNPTNLEAFNELMRVQNVQRNGEKVCKIKTFKEITDFTAALNLLSIYEDLSEKKYDKALELIDYMLQDPSKMNEDTANRLVAQKIYVLVMSKDIEEATKYYNGFVNDNLRRYIANDNSMESIRAYILIAGFLDESQSEVELAASKVNKVLKNTLPSRAEIELNLYKQALEKVYNAHPKWEKRIGE